MIFFSNRNLTIVLFTTVSFYYSGLFLQIFHVRFPFRNVLFFLFVLSAFLLIVQLGYKIFCWGFDKNQSR